MFLIYQRIFMPPYFDHSKLRLYHLHKHINLTIRPPIRQYLMSGIPFYEHWLTLIPAWISNYIHYKVWDEITYPFLFLNFNGCLGVDKQFHPTHYNGCYYLSMLGFKLNHVSERGPGHNTAGVEAKHVYPWAPFYYHGLTLIQHG